jgi:hypothetical protein
MGYSEPGNVHTLAALLVVFDNTGIPTEDEHLQ